MFSRRALNDAQRRNDAQADGINVAHLGRLEAHAWTPDLLTSLKLWLESDVGVTDSSGVTAWADQKGNMADFTASGIHKPTLVANQVNGLPVVRFDGANARLESADLLSDLLAAGSAFKVIAVLKNNSATAHTALYYTEPGVLGDGSGFWAIGADATDIDVGFDPNTVPTFVADPSPGDLLYIEATLTSAAGGTLSVQAGTGGTPSTDTGVGAISTLTGTVILGQNYNGTAPWAGDLLALYVCDSMTADEITNLRAYINAKYGPGL